jgi:5'(3')-deoxyribonucleotidase
MHERERWLMKHFNVDRNHVIFARDKTVIRAVTLIDDNMGNCVEWAHHNSRMAILFAQPWNNREEIFSHCKTLSAKKHHESERFLLVNSDDKKIIAIERSNNWDDIKDTISHIMSRA